MSVNIRKTVRKDYKVTIISSLDVYVIRLQCFVFSKQVNYQMATLATYQSACLLLPSDCHNKYVTYTPAPNILLTHRVHKVIT